MSVWILIGLFLFLLLQIILLVVWYSMVKKSKKHKKSKQEIATAKYINRLEKQIDIEYYI
jgi:membrane protein implicated in regulation of membrane protease activity